MSEIIKTEIDEVVASGLGLATFHLQNSMLTMLVAKGHITMKEAVITISGAVDSLEKLRPTPQARELAALAKQSLKNLEDGWKVQARGH
jgi:hypothetical protein